MIDWQPIKTAPEDTIILLGTESDPYIDKHMFFIDIGWRYKEGFWSMVDNDIRFPSHWAKITSPIKNCPVTHYGRIEHITDHGYFINEE